MGSDSDLVFKQYISVLNETLNRFTEQANEELLTLADNINRCQANLMILESKLASVKY